MTFFNGLSPEELEELEKQALRMNVQKAREFLKDQTGFSEQIVWTWIDNLVKKHRSSLLSMSRRYKVQLPPQRDP